MRSLRVYGRHRSVNWFISEFISFQASDRQGSNFESCVWRTVSSQSSHHPQEVLLAQFSLYVHKGGLKPDSFHFISFHFRNLLEYSPDPFQPQKCLEAPFIYSLLFFIHSARTPSVPHFCYRVHIQRYKVFKGMVCAVGLLAILCTTKKHWSHFFIREYRHGVPLCCDILSHKKYRARYNAIFAHFFSPISMIML